MQNIIDKFGDDNANGVLSNVTKLLKDFLKSLLNENGGKDVIPKLIPALENLEDSHPGLSDLIDTVKDMLKSLRNGRKFNMNDFLEQLEDIFNQIRENGNKINENRIFMF